MKEIKVINARQNNLKGINVNIPYYELSVVTGNSGSGKSSLVYDTIYAESQRMMCDSLIDNTFGIKIMDKPNVDSIENLCPAISISQQSYNFNPNSTVSTFTDISSNLKAIYSIVSSREMGEMISSRDFSQMQSQYRCEACKGTGNTHYISLEKIMPDKLIPLSKGGIIYFNGTKNSFEMQLLEQICDRHNIDWNTPIGELSPNELDLLMNGYTTEDKYVVKFARGSKKNCQKTLIFNGVINELNRDYKKIKSPMIQNQMAKYLDEGKCDICNGKCFMPIIQECKVAEYDIDEITRIEMPEVKHWCNLIEKKYKKENFFITISGHINQIRKIVDAMEMLDIEYLSLRRSVPSLSGGEFQRLRLARQIAGTLVEILYILDEPCKGLHRIDINKIINVTKALIKKGNTVLAIEHNGQYIEHADKIISLGPGSGPTGGYLVQQCFNDKISNIVLKNRRVSKEQMIFQGINFNNIVNESCFIPIGVLTCITGVSGSGKSTLAENVIYKSLVRKTAENCKQCDLPNSYGKVFYVDQNPIGKNARSTVISYLQIYDEIRKIFASISVNKKKYKSSFFSTNCVGGRCEKCLGSGVVAIENRYFSDSYITCDACGGKKFLPFILEVKYKEKNIFEVLEMNIDEALEFFCANSKIVSMLKCITDIGLAYLKLGQMSKNLSGGEAQRLKLAKALGEDSEKSNVYILDEPTSGLSELDITKIEKVIQNLVYIGNTVIIIEHNVNFITNNADYIVDFGFHGGGKGGKIIDQGYVKDVYERNIASLWYDEEN